MSRVTVALGARSYDVMIESGALADAARHLAPFVRRERLIVVSDANVGVHLETLTRALAPVRIDSIVVPSGEASKSWAQLETLTGVLLDLGVERGEHIVALGGGVIGDLAGFAAAIVKRGCGLIQIPTTLLAQVDSSVGGKTAIDTRLGKNLIGAFHQPSLVLIDSGTLATLPARELRAGYAEVVKYGLIGDPDFFAWCEANATALLARDPAALAHAIDVSVRAKAAIVGDDERETGGRRALLNLGHSFGHALEAEAGFSGNLLHGEAVAAGCAIAFRFSAARGLCSPEDAARVAAHLHNVGLPVSARGAGIAAPGLTLAAHMAHDKKSEGGAVRFVLARGIGEAFVSDGVPLSEVAAFLDADRA